MKIGLLANNSLSGFRVNTLQPILKDDLFSIEVAIINNRPSLSLKQKLRKHIKLGRGGYVLVMAFENFFSKKEKDLDMKDFCQENNIGIIETSNPYSPEILEQIKKYKLDALLLLDGYSIIKAPLINSTPIGILSYHHGNMRKYRGQPVALWELYNHEKEMGLTVQILATGLDCGIPVEEKTVAIKEDDTLNKLESRAYAVSEDMMYNALKKLSNKSFVLPKIENFGPVYTLPNLKQWLWFNTKISWRRTKHFFSEHYAAKETSEQYTVFRLHDFIKKLSRIYTNGFW